MGKAKRARRSKTGQSPRKRGVGRIRSQTVIRRRTAEWRITLALIRPTTLKMLRQMIDQRTDERRFRPEDKVHQPWIDHNNGQCLGGLRHIDAIASGVTQSGWL